MKKRCFALLLTLAMCFSLAVPVGAAGTTAVEKADYLYSLGLFKGKGTLPDGSPDYALEASANRNEAATMLIRLLGKEQKAAAQLTAGNLTCPFSDVPQWARGNVTWLYENNYINGTSATVYSGDSAITAQQFAALILRSLGYSETRGDFTYAGALDFAVSKGLLTAAQRDQYTASFLREGMVVMCYNALELNMRDSDLTLLEKLTNDGVFQGSDTSLSGASRLNLKMKYAGGGKDSKYYVQEAVRGTPAVADLDGDGKQELIFGARSLFCLDAATGNIEWKVNSGADRNTPWDGNNDYGRTSVSPQIVDVDGDGAKEIVTVFSHYGNGTSCIAVYNASGYFEPGWPQYTQMPVYALHVADLDGNGTQELCAGLGVGGSGADALRVYEANGSMKNGWPQKCGYGFYSDTIDSGDIDGDGLKELVMIYDDQFVCAFNGDGTPVPATGGIYAGLNWDGAPICAAYSYEKRCVDWAHNHGGKSWASGDHVLGNTQEQRNCLVGTYGGVSVTDMDGNGTLEVACTGMMVDGSKLMRGDTSTYAGCAEYFTTFILNADRTRYTNPAKGFDWTEMPTMASRSYETIDASLLPMADNAPTTVDVDGDGSKEILYSANDGLVHCWNLDGTEHGAWPYDLCPRSASVVTYGTQPACADVNGDGKMEVIFATYTATNQLAVRGQLFVLDCTGKVLAQQTLPVKWGDTQDRAGPNGSVAQPCVADLDGDGKYEIALTTLYAGVVVYDIG